MQGTAQQKDKLLYIAMSAILLGIVGFVGARNFSAKSEQPLVVSELSAASQSTQAAPKTETKRVLVDVVGEVKKPGVYEFTSDARVQDAIAKAGGLTQQGSTDGINRAAKLVDGSQLLIPKKGEPAVVPSSTESYVGGESAASPYRPSSTSTSSSSKAGLPAPASISLNTGSASDLDRLPGVGPSTAAKILEYRRSHGGFTSIDELLKVKGIGTKKLAAMRKYLRL